MQKIFGFVFVILIGQWTFALEVKSLLDETSFKPAIQLYESGQVEPALKWLEEKKFEADKISHKHFLMAKYAFDISFYPLARENIDKAIEYKFPLEDYAYFLKGLIEWEAKQDLALAEQSFLNVLKTKPIRSIQLETKFYLSRLYFYQDRFKEAKKLLVKLRRAYRFSTKRAEVLWMLTQVYFIENNRQKTCRWARSLYSNFPFSKFIEDWDMNLATNKIRNRSLSCLPNYSDQKRRIKKLLWAGKDSEAKRDIEILRKTVNEENKEDIVSLQAEYLLHIGDADEAVTLLLKDYNAQKDNFEYLTLLGYATFKASNFQTSIGSYYKAYQLKPKKSKGRRALFRSAFLSYQLQDYDGATRKFQELIEKFRSSSLARDARYHIAWMKYLKGNYKGAISSFEDILKSKKRSRRRWRKYSLQRIQYWMAMSYLKLNQKETAGYILDHLSRDPYRGYYSFVAASRLRTLGPNPILQNPSESGVHRSLSSLDPEKNEVVQRALAGAQLDLSNNVDEEEDTEESGKEKIVKAADFWSLPEVDKHLHRVESLIKLGQIDWAYRDLKQIESHIEDTSLYPKFVKNYEILQKYPRSSYLSEVKLFPMNVKTLNEKKGLWQSAFPQPYSSSVKRYADDFGVPQNFVWSIMKAESRYNKKAESQVGAKGLMQLMPYTARRLVRLLGERPAKNLFLHNPNTNIKLGTRYLSRLQGKFNNQLPLVAAAYNAGPHRVWSWLSKFGNLDLDEFIEHIPFVETRNYVKRVTRFYGSYNFTYQNDINPMGSLAQKIPIQFKGRAPTKENWN